MDNRGPGGIRVPLVQARHAASVVVRYLPAHGAAHGMA